ncbi:MAG: cell wall hydrolase [Clostridia bacterium]|nr:cell wall hydrolase [Clostridia bacterium]
MNRLVFLSVALMTSAAILVTGFPAERLLPVRSRAARSIPAETAVLPAPAPEVPVRQDVAVTVDGVPYKAETRLIDDGTTYTNICGFAAALGRTAVLTRWDGQTVTVTWDDVTLAASPEALYVEANGRYLFCPLGVSYEDGALWLPLRTLAVLFGCTVEWDGETETAAVTSDGVPLLSGDEFYDEDDVFWLSRIINAEAGGECFLGKIAVGNVVLNRTRSREFPDTIYEVIFDIRFGVQFSPIKSGSIYKTPNADSVAAAKLCLDGAVINDEMLYFYNPKKSKSTWMRESCTFVASIGNHDFFS